MDWSPVARINFHQIVCTFGQASTVAVLVIVNVRMPGESVTWSSAAVKTGEASDPFVSLGAERVGVGAGTLSKVTGWE